MKGKGKLLLQTIVERTCIPLVALATVLAGLILLVSTPPIWELLYNQAMPQERLHDAYREDAKIISRAFWNGQSYESINQSSMKIKMQPKELAHFEDVRGLIHKLFIPLGGGAVILVFWSALLRHPIRWNWAFFYALLVCLALGVWGAIAWRHLFHTFHWWVFQDDSWILPKNSYSLRLYPYAVWQLVGITLISTLSVILLGLASPRFIKRLSRPKRS